MVTDGADTTDGSVARALLALKAEAIPVFTVGLGRENASRDIQVNRVADAARGAQRNVAGRGRGGCAGGVRRRRDPDSGRGRRAHHRAGDGQTALGWRAGHGARPLYRVGRGTSIVPLQVPPQEGEQIAQNNAREALIQVQDRREKILYFDGEPHSEVAFIRRAVADDKNLQVVLLQRTAENKYSGSTSTRPRSSSPAFRKPERSCLRIAA